MTLAPSTMFHPTCRTRVISLPEFFSFSFIAGYAPLPASKEHCTDAQSFQNAEAGKRLATMLEMGASRPWPDALEVISGTREMDATAILDYFAPLASWLDEQNDGRTCGW